MNKLIKAELYKLRKSIYYKVLLLVAVIYAVTDVYFSHVRMRGFDSSSGLEAFISSFTMWGVCLLISGICAGVFIAGDFNNRILHSEIAVGNSRKNIFFSKTIVYQIAGIGIMLTYQGIDKELNSNKKSKLFIFASNISDSKHQTEGKHESGKNRRIYCGYAKKPGNVTKAAC